MANVSNLVQYFIKGSVEGFSAKVAPVTSFAYAVQQDGAGLNDVVRVPFVANETGSSVYAAGTGFTAGSANGVTGKNVTLDRLMYQPIWLEDNEMVRLTPENLTQLGRVAGGRLGADFLSASFATVLTSGNYSNTSTYGSAAFTSSVAPLTLMKQCDDLDFPDDGRVLVIPTDVYFNMLSNSNLSQASQYGNPAAIQQGVIPQIYGFTPYKVTCGITGKGFAAHPSAMAFAFAPFAPQSAEGNNIVTSEVGTDEKSGISITYRSWYDPTTATTKKVICVLGGVAAVNGSALIRIAS